MDWIVVEGVKPWDGRYEFDLAGAPLTTREWGWIKRHSGYLPLTLEDGFAGGDPELFAVFAAVALRRAGRIRDGEVLAVFDRIADAPFGSTVRLEGDTVEGEGDAGPPPPSSSSNTSSSGDGSTTSSETSASPRNGSGIPASDFSGLLPATSENSLRGS